ncbi:cobaltochelatase subunit CobN [Chondrinema litorale]|uniref:cobaltochelatase subunit CobN n=1 Tax=Chondrinema litorale TaxID=2994555 RepID=UPI002542C880|nr:cobaltochelatase subunit CobN [Chondrinema litorale]UZR99777.1 cobaltochelatase subunit CobN [Chondrinema litorale]
MHLISTIPGGWNPNDEGIFYVEQEPGDIVFLSASDTEISSVNAAYRNMSELYSDLPSFRLANLTYFKQELTIDTYLDEVASHAKLIVLRLLGGQAYFNYLCEAVCELAEENDIKVIFLPGHDEPDLELMKLSNVSFTLVDKLWQYLLAAGLDNIREALKLMLNEQFDYQFKIKAIEKVPHLFLWHPQKGIIQKPDELPELKGESTNVSLLITYRAHYLANNLKPIYRLSEALEQQGFFPLVLMALSFRDPAIEKEMSDLLTKYQLKLTVSINTTGFSMKSLGSQKEESFFSHLNIPVIQAVFASCNKETWQNGQFGLPPSDIAMNIALPEVDGKIISTAISFKEAASRDEITDSDIVEYSPHEEGCTFVAELAKNWKILQKKQNQEKHVALILPNYPNKDSRLANGVGLDTPASTVEIIKAMDAAGFNLGDAIPQNSKELISQLTEYITNDPDSTLLKEAQVGFDEGSFFLHYNRLSVELREKIENQWGHPYNSPNYKEGKFLLPGVLLGKTFVSIQPSRGYHIDIQSTYHSPDLPPTYDYLAYYFWVQFEYKADAIVHIGKHGNLEWLPGKSVALSAESCFPAAIFGAIPHFYPFIINDPGEGTQAKRRTHAVILDHLVPPLTRAENYGDLLKLELLIDEYYESALLDPKRSKMLKAKIQELVDGSHLKEDLGTYTDDIDAMLEVIDGYLCELKEAQIRGGLHIFGLLPEEEKLIDLMVALHRLPYGNMPGITQALTMDLQLDFDPVNCQMEEAYQIEINGVACRSKGKVVEQLELLAKSAIQQAFFPLENQHSIDLSEYKNLTQLLEMIRSFTLPKLNHTSDEISNLLHGLNGLYVPSGGSGAPTRGRLDILPTGKNFYSVDVRTVPTPSAYEIGQKSAKMLIERYMQENGEYPTTIGLTAWGTSNMRTGGDDIAQALTLIGVRPVWEGKNRRVRDFEVISLLELRRPRVDVVLRISGFFRDAFPDLISLFNSAVEKVAMLDEDLEDNPIKKRYLEEQKAWLEKGISKNLAKERALFRVFGSKPGAYGAGLQEMIEGRNWTTQNDLASIYINWSGYAYYGKKNEGRSAHEVFKRRLSTVDVVMQNQDNREHDLLDSDDYYQFHGGLTAAVTSQKEESPTVYFGDNSRPENPRVKSLKEELLKVYRSRVVNPKWIKGMQDHGYKGAFEMAATMDYMFAYDATTGLIEDFMYEGISEAYLMEEKNQEFIKEHNPWALKDMSERMLEAIQRGMWKNPSEEIIEKLKQLYLDTESDLEE